MKIVSRPKSAVLVRMLLTLCGVTCFVYGAKAHDPGLSLATAQCVHGELFIHLAMARSDVERLIELDSKHDISTDQGVPAPFPPLDQRTGERDFPNQISRFEPTEPTNWISSLSSFGGEGKGRGGPLTPGQAELTPGILAHSEISNPVSSVELRHAGTTLDKIAREAFIVSCGSRSLSPVRVAVQRDNRDGIQFDLAYPAAGQGELTVRSALLHQLPRGHRQFLSLRGDKGIHLGERMLDVGHDSLTVQVACSDTPNSSPHSIREFVGLGMAHILTGYDHLLFLVGLLLVGGSLRSALQIITSFTCAHSITLALATLNVVNISPRITEPMIAASIVYVGLENLLRPAAPRRWLLTFGFGLIHGFGFASALRELGLGANGAGVVAPLFSFNLGVELGQLAIAALALPLIWKCRASPAFMKRLVPVGSTMVALAGTYWLLQRTLG